MSYSNLIQTPLALPNVDVFTFGESSLFGYDSLNNRIIICSLIELNDINDKCFDYLHLSITIKSLIRRLILNSDETILALIAEETAYLVYLPKSKISPSKGCRLCPANVIPSQQSQSMLINNILIDFVWLSSNCFIVVNSVPSSSECHLYKIQPTRAERIKYIQTFYIGLSFENDRKSIGKQNRRISLQQSSTVVKLDLIRRKIENLNIILVFALKSNGDIYLMELDQNQLFDNEQEVKREFQGPIRILPSTNDNYGIDYSNSNIICLSGSPYLTILLIRNKCQINQCILLKPAINKYYLYTIDTIHLSVNDNNNNAMQSILIDKLKLNKYYLLDSLSNVYSIEITWIGCINEKSNAISSNNIQHLIKSNNLIQFVGLIQTDNRGQLLAFINNYKNNHEKELVFVRPDSLNLNLIKFKSHELISSNEINKKRKEYLLNENYNHIREILNDNKSLLKIINSLSLTKSNMSNTDFKKYLSHCIKIISQECIGKQEQVQFELENKKRYLYDFNQLQSIAIDELAQKFRQVNENFEILYQKYEQENNRRKSLSTRVNVLLSIIKQQTPIISDDEIFMNEKLERYQIKIESLRNKFSLLKESITKENSIYENQRQIDKSFIEKIHRFTLYYKDQLDIIKQQLKSIDHNR